MQKVGSISTAVAIAVAVSLVGVSLYFVLGFSRVEAGLTVACVMLGLAQLVNLTVRDRSEIDVDGIRETVAELGLSLEAVRRDGETLRAQVAALEARRNEDADARSEQLDQQMKILEGLVDQLAAGLERAPLAAVPVDVPASLAGPAPAPFDAPAAAAAEAEILATVRRSIESNRIDLYLQPIVTLPQRRTRYYEGFTRLRGTSGEIILPSAYIGVAERAGVMPEIDNMLLTGCVQIVRRMVERNRGLGIFCNISAHSLLDAEFFPRFIEFMRGNADLSNAVFFEFSQETVNAFGPLEHESLSALRELGFSFSLDRVTRLDFDAEALALRGFRFIKIDCDTLLNRSREAGAQIHGADLSELLRRSGIEMIVEKIETERSVIDLLDYDITFGQGYLFSAPRPVRGEVLEQAPLRATGTT
jgi:cyclic-di-GMP phosphodiesterase, flagellum assembly factor TipF